MRLASEDGTVIELRPLRFQFGPSSEPRDWDANWLCITGDVVLPDGRSWSFTDPCLTTWEARRLGSWLEGVVAGDVQPGPYTGETDERLLDFTEPNLAFSLAQRLEGDVTIRVHLSLEARPPWPVGSESDVQPDLFDYYVEVQLAHHALAEAASAWTQELSAFPIR